MNEFTVKQYAEKEQVTPRTVYSWIWKEAVDFRRTPGGGIRILEPRTNVTILSSTSVENDRNPSK